ncbi:unnamed protein product [Ectocarpus sp. CCAP 1310/34]|nr:unnamed protein product [Ectocarpus sp. CCAP 1310/34]
MSLTQDDNGDHDDDDDDDDAPSTPGDNVANHWGEATEEGDDATEEMPDVESQVQDSEPEAPKGDEEAVLGAPEVVLGTTLEPSATAPFSTDGATDGRFVSDDEAIFAAGEAGMISAEGHAAVAAVVNAVVGETAATDEPTGARFSVDTSPEDPERAHTRDGKQAEDRGQQVSRPEQGVVADVSDFCSWQELVLDLVVLYIDEVGHYKRLGVPSENEAFDQVFKKEVDAWAQKEEETSKADVGNVELEKEFTEDEDNDDHVVDDDAASVTRDDVDDAAAAEAASVTSAVPPEGPERVEWPDGKQAEDRGQVSRAEKDVVADVTDCCSWKVLVLNLVDKDDDPPDDATASVARHHVGDAAASDAAAAEATLLPSPITPEPTGTGFSISPFTWDSESASLSYAQSVLQTDERGQQLPRVEPNGVAHEADCCSWEELVLNLVVSTACHQI